MAQCDDALFCTAVGTYALYQNTGNNNTAIGYQALWSNAAGGVNTASGYRALSNNVTGDGNTANGGYALFLNTTGTQNTAIGMGALYANSTGQNNTASGVAALQSNTTGSFNTATGEQALQSNTTGSQNTAGGINALQFNTTGGQNTASGANALQYNSTGNQNTAFGGNALRLSTTGRSDTASGYMALASNTTGGSNTASGASALLSNTTGSNNTADGTNALLSNTSGLRNVALGYGALKANVTGSDNVALGANAGAASATGGSNIHLGNPGAIDDNRVIRLGVQGKQLKTFIAGIRGATVTGAAVVVSSTGQLGVASSSRRYKEDIQPMGDASDALMKLKPVTFHYKQPDEQGRKPLQFGLIAEDVAAAMPELVVRDAEGKPETVAYHVLPSLLLNEYQKQRQQLAREHAKLDEVAARAEQDHAKLLEVMDSEGRLREALASRDQELSAMRAELKALREVTGRLVEASLSDMKATQVVRR